MVKNLGEKFFKMKTPRNWKNTSNSERKQTIWKARQSSKKTWDQIG